MLGIPRRWEHKDNPVYLDLKKGIIPSNEYPVRLQQLLGIAEKYGGEKSEFNKEKWLFLLFAPFKVNNQCCNVMKKSPVHKYGKETGRKPITAQMASESRQRTQKWLQNGCNGFDLKSPISNPMSFWTEQDILAYIAENNLPICSVYGDIVKDYEAMGQVEGQMELSDLDSSKFGIFDKERPIYKTTGCNRTGCMFCGFGCHIEKESRFVRMKSTHPKIYEWIMKPTKDGGLGYREIIDWINENGKLNIKY